MQSEGGGNCGPGGQQAHQVPVEDFEGEGDCEGEVTWSWGEGGDTWLQSQQLGFKSRHGGILPNIVHKV